MKYGDHNFMSKLQTLRTYLSERSQCQAQPFYQRDLFIPNYNTPFRVESYDKRVNYALLICLHLRRKKVVSKIMVD